MHTEFTGPAKATEGGEGERHKGTNNKECKTDREGFLHLSFPAIRDTGMEGSESKIKRNKVTDAL